MLFQITVPSGWIWDPLGPGCLPWRHGQEGLGSHLPCPLEDKATSWLQTFIIHLPSPMTSLLQNRTAERNKIIAGLHWEVSAAVLRCVYLRRLLRYWGILVAMTPAWALGFCFVLWFVVFFFYLRLFVALLLPGDLAGVCWPLHARIPPGASP